MENRIFDFVQKDSILFIGCHPDDIEIGCGGLLNRITDKSKVYCLTLSQNQENPKNTNLIKEHYKSLNSLGIKKNHIILGDFTTREFPQNRQEICDYLWDVKRKIKPSCIFFTPNDIHQDHQVAHAETLRVFRTNTILSYDIPRSSTFSIPLIFVKLSKNDLNAKLKALSIYKTYSKKNYFSKSSIISHSQYYGIKLELPLCETFIPISIIL